MERPRGHPPKNVTNVTNVTNGSYARMTNVYAGCYECYECYTSINPCRGREQPTFTASADSIKVNQDGSNPIKLNQAKNRALIRSAPFVVLPVSQSQLLLARILCNPDQSGVFRSYPSLLKPIFFSSARMMTPASGKIPTDENLLGPGRTLKCSWWDGARTLVPQDREHTKNGTVTIGNHW